MIKKKVDTRGVKALIWMTMGAQEVEEMHSVLPQTKHIWTILKETYFLGKGERKIRRKKKQYKTGIVSVS